MNNRQAPAGGEEVEAQLRGLGFSPQKAEDTPAPEELVEDVLEYAATMAYAKAPPPS